MDRWKARDVFESFKLFRIQKLKFCGLVGNFINRVSGGKSAVLCLSHLTISLLSLTSLLTENEANQASREVHKWSVQLIYLYVYKYVSLFLDVCLTSHTFIILVAISLAFEYPRPVNNPYVLKLYLCSNWIMNFQFFFTYKYWWSYFFPILQSFIMQCEAESSWTCSLWNFQLQQ